MRKCSTCRWGQEQTAPSAWHSVVLQELSSAVVCVASAISARERCGVVAAAPAAGTSHLLCVQTLGRSLAGSGNEEDE